MKKVSRLLFSLLAFITLAVSTKAASANIAVSTNASRIVLNNNVRVTVTISSSQPLGSWEYTLNYDTSAFSLVSSDVNPHYAYVASNGNTKSVSYNYTFKAKKTGTFNFYVNGTNVIGWDDSTFSVTNGSRRVTQQQLQDSYSKNNDLSSLSVEGFELSPEFNKDTLEYSVTLPPEITNIVINASKADNTASISGIGEMPVSLGLNKFEIIVTAQNGSTKTYVINATVEDLDPINVTVDGKNYTVVRQAEALEVPHTFMTTTTFIDGIEVPALHSDITDITLVGLKNDAGRIALYSFDVNANVYELYQEIKFNSFSIVPKDYQEEMDGFAKTKVEINGIEVPAFVKEGDKEFYIIYGLNTETGTTQLYKYDTNEKTFQRYVKDNILDDPTYKNFLIVMALFGGGLLISLIIIISLATKNKKLKMRLLSIANKNNVFAMEPKIEEKKQEEPIKEEKKEEPTKEEPAKKEKKKKKKDKKEVEKVEDAKDEVAVEEPKKEEAKQEEKLEENTLQETEEFILDEKLAKKARKKK